MLRRLLFEEHGFGRVWTGLAIAICLAGGGLVYQQVTNNPASGYPDASNTGYEHTGVSLTTYSGPCTITADDTVIDSKNITCNLLIRADNVTIKRSKITMPEGGGGICNDCDGGGAFTGLLVEDVEIDCGDNPGSTAVTSTNMTVRRVNAYGCENTIWAENDSVIEDSYLHDNLDPSTPGCPLEGGDPVCHTDGVQGATNNVTIEHNTIYGGYVGGGNFGNSAITIGPAGAGLGTVTITDNILAGGGYTLYCAQGGSDSDTSYTNNKFSTVFVSTVGGFGPVTDCDDEPNFTGNVYLETGLPVS